MIRFKDQVYEKYFIDPVTAVITDKDGNVQEVKLKDHYYRFRCKGVHCIQAHTAWGYKAGYDVHHIDGNPLNNALSNLAYISKSEHMRLHKKNQSEETKHKISLSRKGQRVSEEARKKISDKNKGKPRTIGFTWRKHTEEAKAKMSISSKGQKAWNIGLHWWNNGIKNILCKECPEGFIRGRI